LAIDPATLLQATYKAFREHRLADMLANFSDDFRMAVHLPEEAVPGGDKQRNKAETEELLEYFHTTYDVLAYDPGPIIVTGDQATVQPQVRYRDKRTGEVLEAKLVHTWRVADGKATRLEERHDVEKVLAFLKRVAEHPA
jgi:ketosteroid isomerase-like protein